MKKKILHVITGLENGGAETNLSRVLPALEKDYENRVCCLIGRGPMKKKFEESNIPVYFLDIRSIFGFFNPFVIYKFRKILKDFRPETVETYLIHSDLFGRVWGRIFGVKKIVCNHRGSLLQWEWLSFFDGVTSFLVTKYVFQTKSSQEEITKKLHIKSKKTAVIPNVVNIKDFEFTINQDEKLKELGIKSGNINITNGGSNLKKVKGIRYLIEAFNEVYSRGYKNINLILIGDGDQRAELEQQAKQGGSAGNIYFLGRKKDVNEVIEILKISDIFILPTFAEGMSNAIMEAMASKLAVITTNIDVNKELVKNEYSGLLVPTGNSRKISENLIKLIENPEERKRLGENAFNEIKNNCSINTVCQKINALLESV